MLHDHGVLAAPDAPPVRARPSTAARVAAARLLSTHSIGPLARRADAVPSALTTAAGVEVDVFSPLGPERGTLLCVHGISPRANRDPRLLRLLAGFRAAGLRVLSPRLASVAALRIDAAQPAELAAVIADLAARPALVPSGRLGLLGVSLSASLALAAAARPEAQGRVATVCALGGYTDLLRVIEWLLCADRADEYGRLLVLANGLPHLTPTLAPLAEVFRDAAHDHIARRRVDVGAIAARHARAGRISSEDVARAVALAHDPEARRTLWFALEPILTDSFAPLCPTRGLGSLRSPLTLIHGADDRVIPADESRRLAERAREHRLACRLAITPLISHGDAQGGIAWLGLPALLDAFAGFLDDVAEDARSARVQAPSPSLTNPFQRAI